MPSQAEIKSILSAQLDTLADPLWPTKWENLPFTEAEAAQAANQYQTVTFSFVPVDQRGPGPESPRLVWGFMVVDLYARMGRGAKASDVRADVIIGAFPRSLNIVGASTLGAVDRAWAEMGIIDPEKKWFITPVKVRFFAY